VCVRVCAMYVLPGVLTFVLFSVDEF